MIETQDERVPRTVEPRARDDSRREENQGRDEDYPRSVFCSYGCAAPLNP
jgi:hypothetical protein